MRLFIAINFNETTLAQLIALREELRSRSKHGRFSLNENLHLTLAFLGECDAKQSAVAKAAMNAIKFEPFDTVIDRVGRFKRDGGNIWWAGVRDNPTLTKLQGDLSENLRGVGFTLESRKYNPHITLGREVITDKVPWTVEPFGEKVYKIELMKSERIGGKLTYTAIARNGI